MIFLYDGDEIIGLKYNNHTYYYVKNVFGDVTAILNEQGLNIVEYLYTAWGQVYSAVHRFGTNGDVDNLLELNPIKFRSYYYDADFSMYYLQSRYYWTPICRFLNADLPEYAQVQKNDPDGINLFAYCCNDPVNNSDPTGFAKKTIKELPYANLILYSILNKCKEKLKAKKGRDIVFAFDISKIHYDENGLCFVKAYYFTIKNKKKGAKHNFNILFGRVNDWKPLTDANNHLNISSIYYWSNQIASYNVKPASEKSKSDTYCSLVCSGLIAAELIRANVSAHKVKKAYDSHKSHKCVLIRITKDSTLNDWIHIKM